MATVEQRLTEMLTPAVEALGFELLGIEYVSAGKHSVVRLYIDHEDGINVDNCADVSRQASAILDVEDPISTEYNLEVSSPGMDRPLFKEAHYLACLNEVVSLRTRMPVGDRRNFKGKVLACESGNLTLEIDNQTHVLAIANIEKGNLVPSFD